MARFQTVNREEATGKQKELLEAVNQKMGKVPNILGTMAQSPAALEGYLNFSGALGGGTLSAGQREQIALAVSELNECAYCLAAHSAIGKGAGLGEQEMNDSRLGKSGDTKMQAALQFAQSVVRNRGSVADEEVERLRQAGWSDGEIMEIVANIALTIFTNYFNHIAETDVDFPQVAELSS